MAEVCATCKRSAVDAGVSALLRCSACKAVHYCCAEHQKAHWKDHKMACRRPAGDGRESESARVPRDPSASLFFNVVEIGPNVKTVNGTGWEKSWLNNLTFSSRQAAWQFLQQRACRKVIVSKEMPLVTLMGFEMDLHGCTGDDELNGTCVMLSCSLTDGLSPYSCGKQEPTGTYYAVTAASCSNVLTCDALWGMREVICETREIYGGHLTQQEVMGSVARECHKFKIREWVPRDKNMSGIQIYGDSPDESMFGSTRDGKVPMPIPDFATAEFERLAERFVHERQVLRNSTEHDMEDAAECARERAIMANFSQDHQSAFPAEDDVRQYLVREIPDRAFGYSHSHTKRLVELATIEDETEWKRAVRLVGLELNYVGGFPAMSSCHIVVNHILCGRDFWGRDIHCEQEFAVMGSYNKLIEACWNGVGSWRW